MSPLSFSNQPGMADIGYGMKEGKCPDYVQVKLLRLSKMSQFSYLEVSLSKEGSLVIVSVTEHVIEQGRANWLQV